MKQEGDGITCMILFASVSVGSSFMFMSYCTAARFYTWEVAGFQVCFFSGVCFCTYGKISVPPL